MSQYKSFFNKASRKPSGSNSKKNMFLAPDSADAKTEEFRREVDAILTRQPTVAKKKLDNRVKQPSKFFDKA